MNRYTAESKAIAIGSVIMHEDGRIALSNGTALSEKRRKELIAKLKKAKNR